MTSGSLSYRDAASLFGECRARFLTLASHRKAIECCHDNRTTLAFPFRTRLEAGDGRLPDRKVGVLPLDDGRQVGNRRAHPTLLGEESQELHVARHSDAPVLVRLEFDWVASHGGLGLMKETGG